MPAFTLKGRVLDRTGTGVSNVRVRAYALLNDGTLAGTHEAEVTTGATGLWEFLSLDPVNSESGMYVIEQFQSSSGDTRLIYPDLGIQIENLVGPDGEFPIPAGSIDDTHLASGAVTASKIGALAVEQSKLADFEPDDTTSPASGAQNPLTLISMLAHQMDAVIGEGTWRDTPNTDLATLAAGGGGGGAATELDLQWDTDSPSLITGLGYRLGTPTGSDITVSSTSEGSPTTINLGTPAAIQLDENSRYLILGSATFTSDSGSSGATHVNVGTRYGGGSLTKRAFVSISSNFEFFPVTIIDLVEIGGGSTGVTIAAYRSNTNRDIRAIAGTIVAIKIADV